MSSILQSFSFSKRQLVLPDGPAWENLIVESGPDTLDRLRTLLQIAFHLQDDHQCWSAHEIPRRTLRWRVNPKHLRRVGVRIVLCTQDSFRVLPVVLFAARRASKAPQFLPDIGAVTVHHLDPTAVILKKISVTEWHNVRQCDPSLPFNSCDDPPQVIRALVRHLLHGALALNVPCLAW